MNRLPMKVHDYVCWKFSKNSSGIITCIVSLAWLSKPAIERYDFWHVTHVTVSSVVSLRTLAANPDGVFSWWKEKQIDVFRL